MFMKQSIWCQCEGGVRIKAELQVLTLIVTISTLQRKPWLVVLENWKTIYTQNYQCLLLASTFFIPSSLFHVGLTVDLLNTVVVKWD